MFRRILVPIDFSAKNRRAVRTAASLAVSAGAETTLLHVIEEIDTDAPGQLRAFYARLERLAREKMAPLAAEFEKKGLPVRSQIVYGNRVAEIIRYAEKNGADLIVMSSHKLPLRTPADSWGTISYKVGILSRCPVLLVK
jgi:nucleotide-binding universal stress UspA family protein